MKPHQRNLTNNTSEVLFLTGISKSTTNSEIIILLSSTCIETDFTQRHQHGKVFARYSTPQEATTIKTILHQLLLNGVNLCCRYELGFDSEGNRIVPTRTHNTLIRNVGPRRGTKRSRTTAAATSSSTSSSTSVSASYSYKSISVNNVEYPFPSGLYLTRLIHTLQQFPRNDPLVQLLSNVQHHGNKYAKEISEVMAMVDAVERGIKMSCGTSSQLIQGPIRVFVLGDGVKPFCAAALALHYTNTNWSFVSIDPLLEKIELNDGHHSNLIQFTGKSEEYVIDASVTSTLDIVVACHSHAPLQEFWNRLINVSRNNGNEGMKKTKTTTTTKTSSVVDTSTKKLAIVMACCAEFSNLIKQPLCSFEDYEVYSPKRNVRIYSN